MTPAAAMGALRDRWSEVGASMRETSQAYAHFGQSMNGYAKALDEVRAMFVDTAEHLVGLQQRLADVRGQCQVALVRQGTMQVMTERAEAHFWAGHGGAASRADAVQEVHAARAQFLTGAETREQVAELLDRMLADLHRTHGIGAEPSDAADISEAA